MLGKGITREGCLSADWISIKVPSVGTRDSSSSSETRAASLGTDLHILRKALSFLTQLLFKSTIEINAFMASTPLGIEVLPGMGVSIRGD